MSAPDGWVAVAMDGSAQPIYTMLLSYDRSTGRRRLLVRFPADFSRVEPGSYQTGEEFLVLEGSLELGEQRFEPGDLVVIEAEAIRPATTSAAGALALVAFGARPRWTPHTGAPPQIRFSCRHLELPSWRDA